MALIVVLSRVPLSVQNETALNASTFVGRQEASGIRPIEDHPPADNTDKGSRDALDDKDPGPARPAANAVHERNSGREQPSKGPGEGRGREEHGAPDTDLRALVPA